MGVFECMGAGSGIGLCGLCRLIEVPWHGLSFDVFLDDRVSRARVDAVHWTTYLSFYAIDCVLSARPRVYASRVSSATYRACAWSSLASYRFLAYAGPL